MMTFGLADALTKYRLVPVVVLDDMRDAVPLADALTAGGLPVAEVTLRTPAALESIAIMARDPNLLVGAGTVVRADDVARVVDAGARFVVSPGFSPAVVRECQRLGVPALPGIATATELQMALDAGLDTVKFFPASAAGGPAMVKALAAPFTEARFVPTGGIDAASLGSYLAIPSVVAVGGSWMVARKLVAAHDFATVTSLTEQACAAVRAFDREAS